MDQTLFDRPTTAVVAATARRDAVRAMGAVGMALLAMLGLAHATDAKNARKGVEAAGKKKNQASEDRPARRVNREPQANRVHRERPVCPA